MQKSPRLLGKHRSRQALPHLSLGHAGFPSPVPTTILIGHPCPPTPSHNSEDQAGESALPHPVESDCKWAANPCAAQPWAGSVSTSESVGLAPGIGELVPMGHLALGWLMRDGINGKMGALTVMLHRWWDGNGGWLVAPTLDITHL